MDTTTFLGAVAEAYARQDVDLSEYCFVLPNRRSCTFFLKRLSERLGGRTMLAPEVMAMGEFMARISGLEVAPRVTQLMELYMAYRELRKVSDPIDDEKTLVDFDEFLPWGEVVLSDFSEVDICDVDAPVIAPRSRDILAIGNVVALEPKFVIPGVGAVGIENTYVLTADGLKSLTNAPEQLINLE